MNKKEIKFYLKFHREFRKRYTPNSALKSKVLQLSSLNQINLYKSINAATGKKFY